MERPEGQSILHYRLVEKLGSGGMGEIYKAQDTRLSRFVAIKVLPPSQLGNPEMQRRFVQEARAASALNHPNIITIYDILQDGDAQYIVMEYVAGETLLKLIPPGGLRVPQVLRYATQMADALSAAHGAGIIHRDLKPANVMVTGSELVKLLDFGLAKWTSHPAPLGAIQTAAGTLIGASSSDLPTLTQSPLTVEGSILGTFNYMSPEQAEGKRVDARSDIFSFGAVLYEMTTGRRAFEGGSTVLILSAVLRDEVTPVSVLALDVPQELEEIIYRCLRKDSAARWQSMREVEKALSALRRKSDSGILYRSQVALPSAGAAKVTGSKKSLKSLIYGGAALVVLLAAAGAGGWWSLHRQAANLPTQQAPAPSLPASPAAPLAAPLSSPPAPASQPITTGSPSALPAPKDSSVTQPATQVVSVTLSDALPFRIQLMDDVPADAAEGQALSFRVTDALQVDDTVVIAKGATVTGEVLGEVGKKKFLGFGGSGKLSFRLLSAESVEDEKIHVRATSVVKGDGSSLRPFDTGKKSRSKEIAAARGTEYLAYIDGDQTVSVHKTQ